MSIFTTGKVYGNIRAAINANLSVTRYTWTPIVWQAVINPADGIITGTPGSSDFSVGETAGAGAAIFFATINWNIVNAGYKSIRIVHVPSSGVTAGCALSTGAGQQVLNYAIPIAMPTSGRTYRVEVYQDSDAVGTVTAIDANYGTVRLEILFVKL